MVPQPGRVFNVVMQILAALGAIFATIGVAWWSKYQTAAAEAVSVPGQVIDLVWGTGRKATAKPVVRFHAEGRTVKIVGAVGSSPPAYSVGEAVEVRYTPGKPEDGWINSFTETTLFPLVFGGIGGLMLTGVGIAAWFRAKARGRYARIMGQGRRGRGIGRGRTARQRHRERPSPLASGRRAPSSRRPADALHRHGLACGHEPAVPDWEAGAGALSVGESERVFD